MGSMAQLAAILAGRSWDSKLAPKPGSITLLDIAKKLPSDREFEMREFKPEGMHTMNITSTLRRQQLIKKSGREKKNHSGYTWKTTDLHAKLIAYLKEAERWP